MKFAAPELDLEVLAEFAVLAMYSAESRSQMRLDFAMFEQIVDLL